MTKSTRKSLLITAVIALLVAIWPIMDLAENYEQHTSWLLTKAVITSTQMVDQSSEGNESRFWLSNLEYTREDGTVCTITDEHIVHKCEVGDLQDVIYDPDSDDYYVGGYREDADIYVPAVFLVFCVGLALVCVGAAISGAIKSRKKAKESQS